MDKKGSTALSAMWNFYTTVVGLMPASRVKNWLLSRRPGYRIAADARFGISLIRNVTAMHVEPGATIGLGNTFWNLRSVLLGSRGLVGHFNWFSASPMFLLSSSPGVPAGAGTLRLGPDSITLSHHRLDCSGGFTLGAWAIIGGHGTEVLTHSIAIADAQQVAAPVDIGEYCFIGSRCLVLSNVAFADHVVVGAGAVVSKSLEKAYGFYVGVPAEWKTDVATDLSIFSRAPGVMGVRPF